MKKKLLKVIFTSLLFVQLFNTNAYSEESQIIFVQNERASKIIGLLQEAKELLSESTDKSEINLLKILQRNLTRKYIVLNLYTDNVENKVEEYLNDSIYRKVEQNVMPILIKGKINRKKNKEIPKKNKRKNTFKNIRNKKNEK